ncbi:hypothetical protein FCM35_KLT12982 [Carex littledalei]|uniref:Bifunctional inhibitor/plant lipid transfer protein/seed storage helical domain-containing protein n=1 Tax=Carex littledalei TaxID=544730 RepID=A0A833VHD4_9POAL|nr:hypothetical protein FCM35_KLT12982 [Carex littledalei]
MASAASKPTATPALPLFAFISILFLSLISNTTLATTTRAHAPAPAPVQDCSTYLADLADCIDFVEQGSNSTKPTASCCTGLKKVVRENERCLCDALGNSQDYGIKLNMSRAVAMPSACGVTTPSSSNCRTSVAPAIAPVPGSSGPQSPPAVNSVAVTLIPVSAFAVSAGIFAISLHFLIG